MSLTDEQLRERLEASVDGDVDVDGDLSFVHARTRHRRRRSRIVAATVVLVLGIALAGGASFLTREGGERSIVARPTPSPRPTATTLLPSGTERVPRSAITSYPAPENSGATVALGDGSVWVGGWPSDLGACRVDCGRITRINAKTGEVMATITVPKLPRALVFEFGFLWAEVELPDNGPAFVLKISPATNVIEVQTELAGTSIAGSTGHPQLAAGAGYVWSLYGNRLDQLDRTTGVLLATTTLPVWGDHLVADGQGVWIVEDSPRTAVVAVDTESLGVTEIATLSAGFVQSASIDSGTIWLTQAHGGGGRDPVIELLRVGTADGSLASTGVSTTNVVAGAGRVWFQGFAGAKLTNTHPGWLVELDQATGRPVRAARIDYAAITPPELAIDPTAVWVLGGGTLWRIRV
jgi:hypothetical protein